MEQQSSKVTPLTYTITEEGNGGYDSSKISLMIALPTDTYTFGPYYDISKMIDGKPLNAVLIIMERASDDGSHLPDVCSTTMKCEFDIAALTAYNGPDSTTFDSSLSKALIVVLHDSSANSTTAAADAESFHKEIENILEGIKENGGPIQSDPPVIPRRAGMSVITK
ncbi:MAG: hypothetical protein EOO45_12725 [Flavobacterium sp.]|nr:MAG: hypothetical protein EOO45_12725 [Flavobacterium sp.]